MSKPTRSRVAVSPGSVRKQWKSSVSAAFAWYAGPGSSVTFGAPRLISGGDRLAGASAGSPAGAPALSQAANVAICAAESRRGFRKSPQPAAGGQGGMIPAPVALDTADA